MLELLIFLLAGQGLVNVIAIGRVFRPIREWLCSRGGNFWRLVGWLVGCPMCLAVWVGAGFAELLWTIELDPWARYPGWLVWALGAFALSSWAWSAHVILEKLGQKEL